MKRRRAEGKAQPLVILRLWTREEASRAIPYLRSVVRGLREHALEAIFHRQEVKRLDALRRPLRKEELIAREEATKAAARADEERDRALQELQSIDVYSLSPIRGETMIPFGHKEELAWLVFDLFARERLVGWRFHRDSVETRRPLAELDGRSAEVPLTT